VGKSLEPRESVVRRRKLCIVLNHYVG